MPLMARPSRIKLNEVMKANCHGSTENEIKRNFNQCTIPCGNHPPIWKKGLTLRVSVAIPYDDLYAIDGEAFKDKTQRGNEGQLPRKHGNEIKRNFTPCLRGNPLR